MKRFLLAVLAILGILAAFPTGFLLGFILAAGTPFLRLLDFLT